MTSEAGHGAAKLLAIVYARVSTKGQADNGYSLRQQVEVLKAWCEAEGYQVLEVVEDAGYSGASLERLGLDRVRDLVAEGGVSVVVAQDRDRLAREPAYLYILREEFASHGCKLRALNDRGDDSPEGELTDGILDQLAKFERAKTTERTRRGLGRKVAEGKIVRRQKAPIGFSYSEGGEALVVDEGTLDRAGMRVVRRIFRMIGGEGASLGEVERTLNREGVPSPTGGRWHRPSVRNVVISELYRPLTAGEVAPLVSGQVAATLDPEGEYGLWLWGHRKQTRWRERGLDGEMRNRVKNTLMPRDEWAVVPILLDGSGLSRAFADASREVLAENVRRRPPSTAARRFWELSGGICRCGVCGNGFSPHMNYYRGSPRHYYRCFTRRNSGPDVCSNGRHMAAGALEGEVWAVVYAVISEPEVLLGQYRRHVERQKSAVRGDPDRELRDLHAELSKVERRKGAFLDMAADGDMSRAELRAKLADLDERRAGLEAALEEAKARGEALRRPEVEYERLAHLLTAFDAARLASATPEERRALYTSLRVNAHVNEDRSVRLTGVFDTERLHPDVYLPELLTDPERLKSVGGSFVPARVGKATPEHKEKIGKLFGEELTVVISDSGGRSTS